MAFLTLPLLIAGAGVGMTAYGQYTEGKNAQIEAENQAALAEYNARLAEQQAEEERRKTQVQADIQRKQAARLQAEQRAKYGVSGVLMRGTPLSVLADTAGELELDRLRILRSGEVAYGYQKSVAAGQRLQGSAYKSAGRATGRAATLTAAGTLLTGGYDIYQSTK